MKLLINHKSIAPKLQMNVCVPPTHTHHWDTKRMESGCLVANKTEKYPREGRECQWERLPGNVIYACEKLQTRFAAVKAESSPRLAVTFIPIISAISHPMPDIYTHSCECPTLSICLTLLCLPGKICHKERTFVTSLKVLGISKMPASTPTWENKM